MTYILKNKYLEIHIDDPKENYDFSRFDWTGKIASLRFQHIPFSTSERMDKQNEDSFGKGFYNEFGIDHALGFEETAIGDWFHKIGVGLLKKEDDQYLFNKKYKIRAAKFIVKTDPNKVTIECRSEKVNGYSYFLRKEIKTNGQEFTIQYFLENTGEKSIITDEYVHNFIAINQDLIGPNYVLRFPFQLKPEGFDHALNPESKIEIRQNEFSFNASLKEQFFYSNLTGGKKINAKWELINIKQKIGIRELGSFETNKINLWGWRHVISPELFYKISVDPGQSTDWSRTYQLFAV